MSVRRLAGFTIGVTADRRAAEQAALFERMGATVLLGPTVRVAPVDDPGSVLAATSAFLEGPPSVLVALSAFGISSWLEAAEAGGLGPELLDVLDEVEIWTRGHKPAGAVVAAGLDVARRFDNHDDLLLALADDVGPGTTIGVVLDGHGRLAGADRLLEAGADLVEIDTYRYGAPLDPEPGRRLIRAVADGQVDAVTFTSSAAVLRFLAMVEDDGLLEPILEALRDRCVAVCVGSVAAAAATKAGVQPVTPERGRLGVLVHEAAQRLAHRGGDYEVYGVTFRVQGRLVCVGEDELVLSDRERDLLDALREAGGRVISKGELLRDVWRDDSDPHVVEVNVARLRRRLGEASEAIETVYRRGYRWSGTPVASIR